jgi:hypothetical protein
MSFANLKKNRSAVSELAKAAESVSSTQTKSYVDERFWKPTVDKTGNGYSVIRFLPAPGGEDLPWVRYWDHGFQGPTGLWYIENSLTSINQPDPLSEMNSILWNSGSDEKKEIVRKRKRRLHYVSNIQVITDPDNKDNEGKVFLFKYGKKIFDKVMDVMQPQFQDEDPVNPFDFWEGADFKLKIRQVEGYRNYDKSEFDKVSPLSDDDTKLESIYNMEYSLEDFMDPKNFKSYDELKLKLARVLGDSATPMSTAESVSLDTTSDDTPSDAPTTTSEDDTLSYFQQLAKG